MAINVSKIQSVADDPAHPLRIQPSEMDPTTAPGTPTANMIWFDISGPTLAIKVFKGGVWVTMYETTP